MGEAPTGPDHGPVLRYGDGQRALQDRFDTRRLADRLAETATDDVTGYRSFIESLDTFFLATVDEHGQPQCSHKAGDPGVVRVIDGHTLAFPSYDGNGMYRSLGNIADTGKISMLFVDFEQPKRVRIHGTARVHDTAEWLDRFAEAELVVEVTVGRTFFNCPRYLHNLRDGQLSAHAPRAGHEVPEAEWKAMPEWAEVLPQR